MDERTPTHAQIEAMIGGVTPEQLAAVLPGTTTVDPDLDELLEIRCRSY